MGTECCVNAASIPRRNPFVSMTGLFCGPAFILTARSPPLITATGPLMARLATLLQARKPHESSSFFDRHCHVAGLIEQSRRALSGVAAQSVLRFNRIH